MAEIYYGLPIYFTNSLDYRTRMYPGSWLFSRTTGLYKYLMQEYDFLELTNRGLNAMLTAYYHNFSEEFDNFNKLSIDIDHPNYRNIVRKHFKKIEPKKLAEHPSFFFLQLLEFEIEKLFHNNYITNFMVEIDQKSSSSVFLSMLLSSKKLAEVSNVTTLIRNDPAYYLMTESKHYFKGMLEKGEISPESFSILTTSRTLHKYLFMCFCYNESFLGRVKRLNNNGVDWESGERISKAYKSFINSVFDDLTTKFDELNSLTEFVVTKNRSGIHLKTLDECKICWTIYELQKASLKKKKFKNPITNKFESYHLNAVNLKKINVKKLVSGFFPNIIHSLDASVMRLIMCAVQIREKDYIINHLHDSIQCHPNYVEDVYDAILDVYSFTDFNAVLKTCFYNPMRATLEEKDIPEFDKLFKKFCSTITPITISSETFNPKNMYRFE